MASGLQSAPDDLDFADDLQQPAPRPTPKPTPPAAKQYTNGLFKPLTKRQEDMLNQEYYNKKNMVGRDKLYFSLKRQYGPDAPTTCYYELLSPCFTLLLSPLHLSIILLLLLLPYRHTRQEERGGVVKPLRVVKPPATSRGRWADHHDHR